MKDEAPIKTYIIVKHTKAIVANIKTSNNIFVIFKVKYLSL